MVELLKALHHESGNTVLIVSHDPAEVRHLADHAVFIDGGTIRLSAPIEAFLKEGGIPALTTFLQH